MRASWIAAGLTAVSLIPAVAAFSAAEPATAPVAPAAAEPQLNWKQAREHWSFRVPKAGARPAVRQKAWPRQPLDFFILAKLEQKRLTPSPEADRKTLLRRLTLDLTGLLPTPDETDAFLHDMKPGAYERVVERLLASARFGERMASMWLPLARYGEDQAHQVGADTKYFYPNAHLYRQWVIDAFNRDLPYDRFVGLQLAADKLEGVDKADLAALGFLGLGPKYYNRGRLDVMADEWQDRVDTVTRTFLGLTVACARCHDHKYDPVTTHDYYALAGVFASTKMVNKAPDGSEEKGDVEAAKMRKDTLHIVEDDAKPQNLNVFVRGNVENKGPVVPRRFIRVLSEEAPAPFQDGSGRKELAAAVAAPTNPLTARVMVNRVWGQFFGNPLVGTPSNFGLIGDQPTHPELLDDLSVRFVKGGWSIKGLIREMVLSATYRQSSSAPAAKGATAPGEPGQRGAYGGTRISSARSGPSAITPVSARSGVAQRKGATGSVPNTQLATRSTSPDPAAIDPANSLLWRMNRRRLSVEQWRDSVLQAAGTLEEGGGPSQELSDPVNRKRTLYARISRLKLNDVLMQFDYPDANVHAEKRSVTTTPMQKLYLLNSGFALDQAKALAAQLTSDPNESNESRVRRAYQVLYGRAPSASEVTLALEFLSRPAEGMPRWERYAQVLLAANEMLYVD